MQLDLLEIPPFFLFSGSPVTLFLKNDKNVMFFDWKVDKDCNGSQASGENTLNRRDTV